jgi:restriction system protein
MRAWVVRAGQHGEREAFNLANGIASVGWHETGDLTGCPTREDIRKTVELAFPGETVAKRANTTGQLRALRSEMQVGDLVVLPSKATPTLAIGRITGDYQYGMIRTLTSSMLDLSSGSCPTYRARPSFRTFCIPSGER